MSSDTRFLLPVFDGSVTSDTELLCLLPLDDGSVTSDAELFCLLPLDEATRPDCELLPLCMGKYRDEVVTVAPAEFRCACPALVELSFSSSLGSG